MGIAIDLERLILRAWDSLRPQYALQGADPLVILATVVEGGFARHYAEGLDIRPIEVLVIGSGQVGRELAERLEDRGENVVIIDREQDIIEQAQRDGLSMHQGDGTDAATLRRAGANNAKIVVAATGDDDTNLLVAQLASSKFAVEQIITRVNDPDNEVLIVLVGRDGETQMPSPDFTLQHGDYITFLGHTEAVREAIERCHPELGSIEV